MHRGLVQSANLAITCRFLYSAQESGETKTTTSHLGVIPFADAFKAMLSCLQYVSVLWFTNIYSVLLSLTTANKQF